MALWRDWISRHQMDLCVNDTDRTNEKRNENKKNPTETTSEIPYCSNLDLHTNKQKKNDEEQ